MFMPISSEKGTLFMSQNVGAWRRLPEVQVGMEAHTILPSPSLEQTIVMTISLILEGLLVEPRVDYVVVPN